jgi:hypothetical protein
MRSVRRAGRPERPVDPGAGPQEALAFALRKLREENGNPTYREMAQRAHYSASTLARAASGSSLPGRDLTLAYVRACGGDEAEWARRWDDAAAQLGEDIQPAEDRPDDAAEPGHAGPGRPSPPARGPVHAAGRSLRLAPAWLRRAPRRPAVISGFGIVAAVAGLAIAMLPGGHRPGSSHPPAAHSVYRDGDDPLATGCNQDTRTLDQVPVFLPGGAKFGTLLLRHSPSCAMSWGSVWGPDPHLYRVFIIARRPADGAEAPSSWALNTPPGSYGNMLSTSRSCVMAEAYVRTPRGTGPVARTRCLR